MPFGANSEIEELHHAREFRHVREISVLLARNIGFGEPPPLDFEFPQLGPAIRTRNCAPSF
jgi:hypothetical protein